MNKRWIVIQTVFCVEQLSFTCYKYSVNISFQIDRLQVNLQERDMLSGQSETMLKSKLTDKDEEVARLKAEINILHEKLSQTQAQVWSNLNIDRYTH